MKSLVRLVAVAAFAAGTLSAPAAACFEPANIWWCGENLCMTGFDFSGCIPPLETR